MQQINYVCSADWKVCSTFSSVKDLVNFQWEEFEELEDLTPTLWAALKADATSLDPTYGKKSMSSSVASACVVVAEALLKEKNVYMKAVERLLTWS